MVAVAVVGGLVLRFVPASPMWLDEAISASLAEEAPIAYKDVADVMRVADQAGLCRPVVRLRPLGVIKG